MKRPLLWIIVGANLVGLIALAFVFPTAMVSPGDLMPAHAQLAGDCFACHAPFQGAAPERCVKCHVLADIGQRTTSGAPVARAPAGPTERSVGASFHRELTEPNCSACHTDHGRYTRGRFSHALLPAATRADCARCHSAPNDALHRQITDTCTSCHSPKGWKPATFDHDRYFVLDRHHNVPCETCHINSDLTHYSCYGCHEHTPAKMRAKHEREGIRDFEDCASCHKSADDHEGGRGEGGGLGEGRGRQKDRKRGSAKKHRDDD